MAATTDEIRLGELTIRYLLAGGDTDGGVALFEFRVPAGAKVPAAHSHDGYDEIVYGLAGVLTWTVDGDEVEMRAGEVLFVPRGAVHRFENRGGADAAALAVATPGLLGAEYFLEMAAVVGAATSGPPDPAALADVMLRHGLTPAP